MTYPLSCGIPEGSENWDRCPTSTDSMQCEDFPANLSISNSFHGNQVEAALSITSSSLSCLGSLLIIYSYCKWKDIRTGSRKVITFLAIADLVTALGYILGSANYISHLEGAPNSPTCQRFVTVCTIQSFITSWSSISSFLWTIALAVYLYCTVVHSKITLASKLIPYFHFICWGFPILICLPLLITNNFGYSPFAAATWCYIYEPAAVIDNGQGGVSDMTVALILIGGKLWEILSYFVVIGLYVGIKVNVRKQTKLGESTSMLGPGLASVVKKADRKLTFIPIVFVLLRFWGTLQFFYSLGVSNHIACTCTSRGITVGFRVLGCLQAIGDGGQGWGNVLLYVLASDKIRQRLLGGLRYYCSSSELEKSIEHEPPLRRVRGDGDRHVALAINKPVMINVDRQSVTYHSGSATHEPTSTIN